MAHIHLQSDRETVQAFICVYGTFTLCVCIRARLCVCLCHVFECQYVVASVVCLCLNQPVNTHVEYLSFLPWECVTICVKLKAPAVGKCLAVVQVVSCLLHTLDTQLSNRQTHTEPCSYPGSRVLLPSVCTPIFPKS